MKIGERGQVTIPQKFRQRFGLKPKAQVEFVELDGQLVLRKAGRPDAAALRAKWASNVGILKFDGRTTDDIMRELRPR
jgi:AbrB family looped-hinge helix DNA binding protein